MKGGKASALVPGGVFESVADQLADLFFQGAIMGDAPFAFAGLFGGEGLGGGVSLQEAGPAVSRGRGAWEVWLCRRSWVCRRCCGRWRGSRAARGG